MNSLYIEKTALTPLVIFDEESSFLKLEGRMIPEDVEGTFSPINTWIENYFETNQKLHLLFRLYYYNTSSARQFFLMFKKLDAHFAKGKDVFIRWEYEEGDEDSMSDAGEFLSGVRFSHEIVPVIG
jgi:hypothetical protein